MKYITFLLFAVFIGLSVQAQDANNFFHRGANSFINSQLNQAIQIVDEGLFQFPNDAKLNALKQKLEEEKEKQQQQQQDQQQQNQDQQEQDQEQQEQNQDQQENPEQDQEKEQDQEQGEGAEENEPKPQEGKEIDSKEISKEDAEKILQALAQKEKELLKDFKKKKSKDSAKHDKDW